MYVCNDTYIHIYTHAYVLQSQLSGEENEVFEINFEVKGMTSKLKLLETERDELQASDS